MKTKYLILTLVLSGCGSASDTPAPTPTNTTIVQEIDTTNSCLSGMVSIPNTGICIDSTANGKTIKLNHADASVACAGSGKTLCPAALIARSYNLQITDGYDSWGSEISGSKASRAWGNSIYFTDNTETKYYYCCY